MTFTDLETLIIFQFKLNFTKLQYEMLKLHSRSRGKLQGAHALPIRIALHRVRHLAPGSSDRDQTPYRIIDRHRPYYTTKIDSNFH